MSRNAAKMYVQNNNIIVLELYTLSSFYSLAHSIEGFNGSNSTWKSICCPESEDGLELEVEESNKRCKL